MARNSLFGRNQRQFYQAGVNYGGATVLTETHSMQQILKPRIESKIVPNRIHLDENQQRIALPVSSLKPCKRFVFILHPTLTLTCQMN